MELNYFSKKNFIGTLAAILVVAMGYMAIKTYKKPAQVETPATFEQQVEKLEMQSDSDALDSIEKDLQETDLENLDTELQNIDRELNSLN